MRARWMAVSAAMLLLAGLVGTNALAGGGSGTMVRWDIVSIDFENGEINEGGIASATAGDGSKITITGKGTFRPREPERVTGGGTYELFDKDGNAVGSGTYVVTRLLHWKIAPGEPPELEDNIGNPENRAAGLAFLKVRYSDGERGVVVVNCHLVGTPDSVPEGISAAKGFVDYYNVELPPAPPGDENRTLFHVKRG